MEAVLVGVKAWQVTDAASAIRPLVGPKTVVVPLQNGVEAASELAAVLGSATLGGMCGTLSFVAGPGHIRSVGGQNFIKFGELDNKPTERIERLRECFAHAKVSVEIPADIVKALWDKFLMVTSFGGVGSITRAPIGVTRAIPETRRLLEQCLKEAMAVGTPVVAADLAGIPEILDQGRSGVLVPPREVPALAEAIERLLADEALRRRYAEAARRHVEHHFDLWRNGRRLADCLRATPRRPG